MRIESATSPEGWPSVTWVQQWPVTSKGMQDIRKATIRAAIVVAVAILAFVAGGPGNGWVGMSILIWGLIWVAFKSGPPPGFKWEVWAKKPVTVDCEAQAFVEQRGDSLRFAWRFRTRAGEVFGDEVPLDSFTAFEVGALSDWFTAPQDEGDFGGARGVMIHVQGEGPKCVAAHFGAPADLATLEERLTASFIHSRPALSARLKPPAPAAPSPVPRDKRHLPKDL